MVAFVKFNAFPEHLAEGVHNLQSHSLKALLSNTAPNVSTMTVKADMTEISAGNGYTAGGFTVTISSSAQTGGVYKAVATDITITASGGAMAAFRYVYIMNDTPTSPADPLINYYDYGSSITLQDGESFVIDFDATNGFLQIA